MPRTTIDIDPSVLRELRERSRRAGKSMGRVASEILARGLSEADAQDGDRPFRWKTWDMGKPLVDLEDKEAVWKILDAE
ncbi:MAG: antitoxin [Actinomycetota bacterium]